MLCPDLPVVVSRTQHAGRGLLAGESLLSTSSLRAGEGSSSQPCKERGVLLSLPWVPRDLGMHCHRAGQRPTSNISPEGAWALDTC